MISENNIQFLVDTNDFNYSKIANLTSPYPPSKGELLTIMPCALRLMSFSLTHPHPYQEGIRKDIFLPLSH